MANFFRKSGEGQEPEDFVLFTPEDEEQAPLSDMDEELLDAAGSLDISEVQEETSVSFTDEEVFGDTSSIDISEVQDALASAESAVSTEKKKGKALRGLALSRRFYIAATSVILVAAIIAFSIFGIVNFSNSLYGYEQVAAEKNNIIRSFEVDGILESGNRYEITSLVAGKIITADFEVGDEVQKGDVLYKLDDTEAKLVVERAKNELDRAKDPSAGPIVSTPRIIATDAGVIQSLKITTGSIINAGSHIGTLKKSDDTVVPIISYVSGKVNVVSVRAGQSLSVGQLIATVKDETAVSGENSAYNEKSSEIDLQTAQRQLDDYTIKSPVNGVVVEKSSKAGDNVGITNSDKPMMVIIDTSELSFKFSVDEYRMREVKRGQSVIVTTESIPDTPFDGEITTVSTQGYKNDEGRTMFDVTVTISKPGDLKTGMNIHGKVILESKKNVLSVPQQALMASDGKNALVLVKKDIASGLDDTEEPGESIENQLAFPWIKVPKSCDLISVTYGTSDGVSVQILSGLNAGDIVVYEADSDNGDFIQSTVEDNQQDGDFSVADPPVNDGAAEVQQDLQREIEDILQQADNV